MNGFRIGLIVSVLMLIMLGFTCRKPMLHIDYSIIEKLRLEDKRYYELGKYRIYPTEKRILVCYHSGSGEQGDYWEGCYLDTIVNFDSTTLVFAGNTFDFKEYYPQNMDINSFKVLDYDIEKDYSKVYYKDKNAIYNYSIQGSSENYVDISHMEGLNDRLYRDKDGLIYLISVIDPRVLWRVDMGGCSVDWKTFHSVVDDCFADKRGLYYFERVYNRDDWHVLLVKLQSSEELKKNEPLINKYYFVYGDSVYLRESRLGEYEQKVEKLPINGNEIKEYVLADFYDYVSVLTDGKYSYIYPHDRRRLNEKLGLGDVSLWQQLTDVRQRFVFDKKKATLYYTSHSEQSYSGEQPYSALIRINKQYYLIGNFSNEYPEKMISVDKVMIYTGQSNYEELNPETYKYVGGDLYIYKNVLYGNLCTPIKEGRLLNLATLVPIKYKGVATRYFTDGKLLFYNDEIRSFTEQKKDQSMSSLIIENVDYKSLRVVNKFMLIDKNNIYNETKITPIDSLGVKVRVFN